MNKQYIQNIEDISDSCEMLSEKPHHFLSLFTYILIGIIGAALLWSFIGEIDYYVKANGIVRPGDKVSTVRNMVTGQVTDVNISEGASVKKGDVLFKIDVTTAQQTIESLKNQKTKYELDIQNLNKFKQSITDGKNLFDQTNTNESDYYFQYEKYVTDVKTSNEQYNNTNLDIDKAKNDADNTSQSSSEQLAKAKLDLQQIDYLIQSIQTNTCAFPDMNADSIYPNKYQEYVTNIEKYNQSIKTQTDTKDRIEKLYIVGGVSKVEYDKAVSDLAAANLELTNYKQTFLLSIEQSKEQLNNNIKELTASVKNADDVIGVYSQKGYSTALAGEKIKLDTLLSVANQITTQQANLDSTNNDLKELESNIASAEVTAPIDGTINMYTNIAQSDYIQSGLDVATIVPNSKGKYKVQLYISTSDISEIKVNQKIKLRFSSLNYQEYGEFTGTLVNISTDSRSDSNSEATYYIAECVLDNEEIKNKDGVVKEVQIGMDCEARVITKQRKIIYWLLEKMNFID